MDFKNAMDTLIAEIKRMIEKAIEAAPFDKTYRGRVVAVDGNKYSVQINGTIHEIKTTAVYAVGDYMNVLVPRNDWEKIVIVAEDAYAETIGSSLSSSLNTLDLKTDGFASHNTVFATDGGITETFGNKKIVTNFVSDTQIIQQLYESDVLMLTKTINFSPDGTFINEEVA